MIYTIYVFSGIIRDIGILKTKKARKNGFSLLIETRKLRPKVGDSIAVNGVCLTVTTKQGRTFCVDVIAETLRRTNLKMLMSGAGLNLELSLKVGDTLSGNFVTGHIDVACRVLEKKGNELYIKIPSRLNKFIVQKGAIVVNGVSLTVAKIKAGSCMIALTPFTEKHTNLGMLKKGEFVNIEVDLIARYLYHLKI